MEIYTMSSSRRPKSTREAILVATAELLGERGAGVALEEIAERAGVSRQTLYLHFGSRTGLMIATAQHIDEQGTLGRLLQEVFEAPTALDALDAIVSLHAEYYPVIYPIARLFMAGKYHDDALRAAWDDRMQSRHGLYHEIVERLHRDGVLAPEWDVETATDILWSITSWELWEQLTLERGWSEADYLRHLRAVLRSVLCHGDL
jgi:AcrR family transcriptional regulator